MRPQEVRKLVGECLNASCPAALKTDALGCDSMIPAMTAPAPSTAGRDIEELRLALRRALHARGSVRSEADERSPVSRIPIAEVLVDRIDHHRDVAPAPHSKRSLIVGIASRPRLSPLRGSRRVHLQDVARTGAALEGDAADDGGAAAGTGDEDVFRQRLRP
jgi:hypothetical protein